MSKSNIDTLIKNMETKRMLLDPNIKGKKNSVQVYREKQFKDSVKLIDPQFKGNIKDFYDYSIELSEKHHITEGVNPIEEIIPIKTFEQKIEDLKKSTTNISKLINDEKKIETIENIMDENEKKINELKNMLEKSLTGLQKEQSKTTTEQEKITSVQEEILESELEPQSLQEKISKSETVSQPSALEIQLSPEDIKTHQDILSSISPSTIQIKYGAPEIIRKVKQIKEKHNDNPDMMIENKNEVLDLLQSLPDPEKQPEKFNEYITQIVLDTEKSGIVGKESKKFRDEYNIAKYYYLKKEFERDRVGFIKEVEKMAPGIIRKYEPENITKQAKEFAKEFILSKPIKRNRVLDIPFYNEKLSTSSKIMTRPTVIDDEVVFGEKPKSLIRIKTKKGTQLVKNVKQKDIIKQKIDITDQVRRMNLQSNDQRLQEYVVKPKQRHNKKIRVKFPVVRIEYKELKGKPVEYKYGNILTKEDQLIFNMAVANIAKLGGLIDKHKNNKKLVKDVKELNKLLNYYNRILRDISDKYY